VAGLSSVVGAGHAQRPPLRHPHARGGGGARNARRAPTLLEETQQGKTFARRVRYSLSATRDGTVLRVEDNVVFKGLGRLAAPLAARDVRNRWATSLPRLKSAVESGQ
jgi:hypothetical protein